MRLDEDTRTKLDARIEWWLNDAAYKPPELLSETTAHGLWYMNCMSRDLMQVAANKLDFRWSSKRLNPPDSWR